MTQQRKKQDEERGRMVAISEAVSLAGFGLLVTGVGLYDYRAGVVLAGVIASVLGILGIRNNAQ